MAPDGGDCNKNDGPVKREIIPARAGRENQRYGDGGERLTAGCIVLRQVLVRTHTFSTRQVCLAPDKFLPYFSSR